MTDFKIDTRDVFYILKEQLNYGTLCNLAPFADLNEKTLDLMVNEAIHFAKGVLDPLNQIAEETPLHSPMGRSAARLNSKRRFGNMEAMAGPPPSVIRHTVVRDSR